MPCRGGRQDVGVVVAEVVLAGSALDLRPIEGLTKQADPERRLRRQVGRPVVGIAREDVLGGDADEVAAHGLCAGGGRQGESGDEGGREGERTTNGHEEFPPGARQKRWSLLESAS